MTTLDLDGMKRAALAGMNVKRVGEMTFEDWWRINWEGVGDIADYAGRFIANAAWDASEGFAHDKLVDQRNKLLHALKSSSEEFKKLPHSLGYDITHCEKYDTILALIERLETAERERDALQARLDALMLEYCPEDMTPEQRKTWGENQRPVSEMEAKAIDRALRNSVVIVKGTQS